MQSREGESAPGGEETRQVKAILDRANDCFQRALKALQGGQREWADQELDHVIADCGEAIRIDDKHPAAYQLRARAYEHKGEDEKAEADLKWARRLSRE